MSHRRLSIHVQLWQQTMCREGIFWRNDGSTNHIMIKFLKVSANKQKEKEKSNTLHTMKQGRIVAAFPPKLCKTRNKQISIYCSSESWAGLVVLQPQPLKYWYYIPEYQYQQQFVSWLVSLKRNVNQTMAKGKFFMKKLYHRWRKKSKNIQWAYNKIHFWDTNLRGNW